MLLFVGVSHNVDSTVPLASTAPDKPNIVFILSDDQTSDSTVAMPFLTSKPGGHWFEFTNAFNNTPLCCPSRATLLSGLYPHHHGVEINSGAAFDDTSTIATWLKGGGYRTGLAGKYLNNYPWAKPPTYIPPGWDDWFADIQEGGHYSYTMNDNGALVNYGSTAADYQTDVVARRADQFIRQSAGSQPFFLYAAPIAPHAPLTPPQRYKNTPFTITRPPNFNEADVSDKPAWVQGMPLATAKEAKSWDSQRQKEFQMVLAVDDVVRTVYQALAETGELDDTVIVFQTDNGVMYGEHRLTDKGCVYEECVGTPSFIRVPWLTGRVDPHLISNIDIAPTFADLGGVTPASVVDGTSLVPLLEDGDAPWRSAALLEYHGGGKPSFWAIRTAAWKYAELDTGERELYDMINDPFELANVAGAPQHAALEASLASDLAMLRTAPPHWVLPVVSIADASVVEGTGTETALTLTLELSGGAPEGASVGVSTQDGTAGAPDDYGALFQRVDFAPGEDSATISVTIQADALSEENESFTLVLDDPQNLVVEDPEASATIVDDDGPPAVSIDDIDVVEGDAGATDALFTLSLSHAAAAATSVGYATADGTATAPDDYTAIEGVASFVPGATTTTVSVPVSGDEVAEGAESFVVTLTDPQGLVLGDAVGSAAILDDDQAVTASIGDATVVEGNGGPHAATFTVTVFPAPPAPIEVTWSTGDGSATAGSDYATATGVVSFAPGQTNATLDVSVFGDALYEDDETMSVSIASEDAVVGDGEATGSILNDDIAPAVAIADTSANEASSGVATFVVTLSAPSGMTTSIAYASANGTAKAPGDYLGVSGVLVFAPGETSKIVAVTIVNDTVVERAENFTLNLSSPVNATIADNSGRCVITSDE